MKKIALFGGTFDPIHFGHINLALQLLEKHHLDEVLFCPSRCSPLKRRRPPIASSQERCKMVEMAIQPISAFKLSLIEINQKKISYTIDTLRQLKARYDKKKEKVQLYLLLSQEAEATFHQWKEADQIPGIAELLVGSRAGVSIPIPQSPLKRLLKKAETSTREMEISSTLIRMRLKKNLYCGHLLPLPVLEYIERHEIYK